MEPFWQPHGGSQPARRSFLKQLGVTLAAGLGIAALRSQPAAARGINFECPEEDIAGGCKGPKDCLYPHPSDCGLFIQCNDAGVAYEMPCPAGLQWNDNKKICDYPHQSTCPE